MRTLDELEVQLGTQNIGNSAKLDTKPLEHSLETSCTDVAESQEIVQLIERSFYEESLSFVALFYAR